MERRKPRMGGIIMERDYSKGQYVTVLSKKGLAQILSSKKKPYDAKSEARKAKLELRKQGLKV